MRQRRDQLGPISPEISPALSDLVDCVFISPFLAHCQWCSTHNQKLSRSFVPKTVLIDTL
jgi:hypothetical protein